MKKCLFLTEEKYENEWNAERAEYQTVKKTVFMDCIGCGCVAYNSISGKCAKTGQIARKSGSLLASGYTVKSC